MINKDRQLQELEAIIKRHEITITKLAQMVENLKKENSRRKNDIQSLENKIKGK